jgi:putative addiction module component (TIGR02574 family)
MGTTELREELHHFINRADERILRLIHGMMKADIEEENDYALSDAHKQILDERVAAHDAAPDEGSTWDAVKDRIKKRDGL